MSQPGCGIIFSPSSQRIDRRNSLRRSFILGRRRTSDRANTPTSQCNVSVDAHHNHSRSLSDKMRRMQMRSKRDQQLQEPLGVLKPAPSNIKKTPKHMDLLEAASQTDCDSIRRPSPTPEHMDIGMGKENVQTRSLRNKPKPFNGDPTYRSTAYKQYMAQSFGLEARGGSKTATPVEQARLRPPMDHRPDSEASAMTTDSMEVNFHVATDIPVPPIPSSARKSRPKLQVQVPGSQTPIKRPTSTAHLISQIDRQKSKRRLRQSTQVSPPDNAGNSETPARLSIVSPLSVVEMPKPRRPFSALSLEDATQTQTGDATRQKSDSSDSSAQPSRESDRSNGCTRRSSMSSLTSVATVQKPLSRRHSIAFSIADPIAAGVFDSVPPVPQISNHLQAMRSTASLAPDTNKPLPPEPGLEEVQPLRLAHPSYSRGSDLHPKRKAPSPLNISRSSTVSTIRPQRNSSLRSKYTPADLDALDAAFVKSSPQVANFAQHSREASWEQAQNALEEHLDTIVEDDTASGIVVPLACDPLQISRMTNEMVPTRQAPAPPSASAASSIKLSDGSTSSRNRLQKQPSKHILTQWRGDRSSGDLRNRISAPVVVGGGNLAKANKILGKTEEYPTIRQSVQMEREVSKDSNWSSSDSPDDSYNGDSSSPGMSARGDTTTPETDVSSIPDHAFEEIRNRMELLSPKNDSPFMPTLAGNARLSPCSQGRSFRGSASHSPVSFIESPIIKDSPTVPSIEVTPLKEDNEAEAEIEIALDNVLPSNLVGDRKVAFQERPRSLASIAMSEIPDMYAQMPESEDSSMEEDGRISADAAEIVLLRILEHLDNLQDLFATATVSRGFYRTFKRHELPLMKSALYGMSPAAWELREVTPPYPGLQGGLSSPLLVDYSPSLYLQHYMRDMYTMIALKSMILIHCESFLRADTITALAGGETERASQIDDAFWRVWTFCQTFGCGANREDDITAQLDWLRGGEEARKDQVGKRRKGLVFAPVVTFGYGNADGLSAEELYDMTEIWTCMGVLVRGFHGKRQEAREYGIFDNAADVTPDNIEAEDRTLEEWTHHLLTLAPPTVLDVTSPTAPTTATFAHARTRGYTNWTPPAVSRATFLKEPVSRIYQERIAEVHPSSAPSTPIKNRSPSNSVSSSSTLCESQSNDSSEAPNEMVAARWRCARHAAEIRAKRNQPGFNLLPPSEDRPMSNYPDVLEKLDAPVTADVDAPEIPSLPNTVFNGLRKATPDYSDSETETEEIDMKTPTVPTYAAAATSKGSEEKKNPKFEMDEATKERKADEDTEKLVISALVVPKGPQVRDPIDLALERLTNMGFPAAKAKKALAESDTGNSISFDAALESLVRERKRDVDNVMHSGYRGGVSERRKAFEGISMGGASLGMGDGDKPMLRTEDIRPKPLRVGSVRRLASQMEVRRGSNGAGVGLGIGGVSVV